MVVTGLPLAGRVIITVDVASHIHNVTNKTDTSLHKM